LSVASGRYGSRFCIVELPAIVSTSAAKDQRPKTQVLIL
jgi:hypothetical protein